MINPHDLDPNDLCYCPHVMDPEHPARKAARYYAKRCWWSEVEDLEQHAFAATCQALTTFNADVGIQLTAYLYAAANYALFPYLWSLSSPASAKRHACKELRGVHRVPLRCQQANTERNDHRRDEVNPEIIVARHMVSERIQARLQTLLTDAKQTEIVLPILLDQASPRAIAAQHGKTVKDIYLATLRAKRRIAADQDLWSIWSDL